MAYLAAYDATGERGYLEAAEEAARALMHGQLQSGGWANRVDFDPAGAALYRNGTLILPTQNCSTRYGGSTTLLAMSQLSNQSLSSRPVAEISVKTITGMVGTHTYSRSSRFEAIDVWGTFGNAATIDLQCRELNDQSTDMRRDGANEEATLQHEPGEHGQRRIQNENRANR